ncbi:MAG: glycosyltransferase family 39 protein [Nitrosospira sp.]
MGQDLGIKSGRSDSAFQWRYKLADSLSQVLDSAIFIPACFMLFLGLRAALIFFVPIEMDSDASWYLGRAVSIANGKGYSEDGNPTAYWPVGYPGFLGVLFYLFGQDQLVGQLANLLMAAGIFFLQLELTRRIFRNELAARFGILLLTIYPNHIAYTSFILTEVYFTFLLLLGVYLYISRRDWLWIFLSGLVFGLATLTKPQILFLPGLLVLFRVFSREEKHSLNEHLVKGFVIYLVIIAVLTPWAIRNSQVFGEVVLISTNGGATLLTGNNPSANGGYVENDALVAQRNFSVSDQVAADRRARKLAIEWIKENPARFVELIPLKIWSLWAKDGEAEWAYEAGYAHYQQNRYFFRSLRWANQVFYGFLLIGAIVAFVSIVRNRHNLARPWVFFGYCLVFYLTIISIVFSGQPRFHFPAMPWIIMYAAWAVVIFSIRQPQERNGTRAPKNAQKYNGSEPADIY